MDHSVDLLEIAPTLRDQPHGRLVPAVHVPLSKPPKEEKKNEPIEEPKSRTPERNMSEFAYSWIEHEEEAAMAGRPERESCAEWPQHVCVYASKKQRPAGLRACSFSTVPWLTGEEFG